MVSFFHNKLLQGQHCDLPDHVITDVIISTINNNLLRTSAQAAGGKTSEKLLKFLVESDYANIAQQPENHKPKNKFVQGSTSRSRPNCFLCGQTGHKAHDWYKNKPNRQAETCTFCKKIGHTREKCFKLTNTTKVNHISQDDTKYHVKVQVNGKQVGAYIDFGSACNIMKIDRLRELALTLDKKQPTILQGYGGAFTVTLGRTVATIKIDEVEQKVSIEIVANYCQRIDLLIG